MELKDYIKIIRKHLIIIFIVVILSVGFAYFFTKRQPTSYTAQTTFTVNKTSALKQSQVSYYLYDNYYNIQSAGLFSQVVTTWFSSPSVVAEIYQKAGIAVPNVSEATLSQTFKTTRDEPATINVTISGTDRNQLNKLINASADVLQAKANDLNDSDNVYKITEFQPIVTSNSPDLLVNTLIGLVAGIILGIIIALGIGYFKGGTKN